MDAIVIDVCVWAESPRGDLEGSGLFTATPENPHGLKRTLNLIAEAVGRGLLQHNWNPYGKMELYLESRPQKAVKASRLAGMQGREASGVVALDWACIVTRAKSEGGD